MEAEDSWQLILLVVLLALSAFFSASETALMSLSKIRIRHMVDENVPGAKKVKKLIDNPNNLLSSILVGNNLVNIGASALVTAMAIKQYGNAGVGIATGIMTFLILIFGEITPKSFAAQNSERISLKVASVISVIIIVLKPVNIVLNYLTKFLIKILGGKPDVKAPFITEAELKTMINVGHEEGVLESEEKMMIHNVFEFGEARVIDVMIPRTYMVSIEKNASYEKVIDVFKKQRFSRIPVYEDSMDNIIGVLHFKDLFLCEEVEETFDITKFLKEPYFTLEYKLTTQLFREMRDKGIQMAIVIDEYGGTAGVITIEDLIEEIVGDIHDEADEPVYEIEVIREDEYLVLGITKIDTVNEMIGVTIFSDDFDSIGGFVMGLFGRLPEVGEVIDYKNIQFTVEKMHRNRIEKLRIMTGFES